MRLSLAAACLALSTVSLFGQAGTGTITGTVTDPAGAVIPRATIEVRSTETNVLFPAQTTETGAYTVLRLPPGPYNVTVAAPGFKKLVRDKINVAAGQVLPLDLALDVGSASESVTVSAEATLLKTESGDVVHNVTLSQLNNLPILGIGGPNAGSNGIRNPYNAAALLPGVRFQANFAMIVNGAPTNTAAYRIEGLDNTNHTVAFANTQVGQGFGFLDLFGASLYLLFGWPLRLVRSGHEICSGLVVKALQAGGLVPDLDAALTLPADLAKLFDVRP